MERSYLYFGQAIKGKADKKNAMTFCRNSCNNRINDEDNSLFKKVSQILEKKWAILVKLNAKEKVKTGRSKLLNAGFSFDYFTSIYYAKKGNNYFFRYNYGCCPIENDVFLLVEREQISARL